MSYDIEMPVVPFRVESDVKELLKHIAHKRDSSVNAVVRQIVEDYLRDKGYIVNTRKIQNV